jgi:hypothetical protein
VAKKSCLPPDVTELDHHNLLRHSEPDNSTSNGFVHASIKASAAQNWDNGVDCLIKYTQATAHLLGQGTNNDADYFISSPKHHLDSATVCFKRHHLTAQTRSPDP